MATDAFSTAYAVGLADCTGLHNPQNYKILY